MAYPYNNNGVNMPMMGFNSPIQRLQNFEQQQFYPTIPSQPQSSIIWVQGAEGAKSYMIPPNTTVLLMDSEGTKFYLKSTDGSGLPSMRIFEFREITNVIPTAQNTAPQISMENFVQRQEFLELQKEVNMYKDLLSSLTSPENSHASPTVPVEGGNHNGK